MGYAEVSQLNLGSPVAESDPNGIKYFISTPTYLNAKDPTKRKTYYVGQRGAGKTALFDQLAADFRSQAENVVLKITPDDFSYAMFHREEHDYSNIQRVYGTVWHYTFLAHMFRRLVEYFDQRPYLKTNRENVATLRRYITEKDVLKADGFLGVFLTFFGDFTTNPKFNRAMKVGAEQNAADKALLRLGSLSDISQEMRAFSNITDTHPIYVFIDELDTGWDNSKEARDFIHGLFYAVGKIKSLRNVILFVSLRSDMYNDLSDILPDPEKMRPEVETFSWNPRTLRVLVAKRIRTNYQNYPSGISDPNPVEGAISNVFDDGILDYILDHSLMRPREIIQFCNDALSEFSTLVDFGRTPPRVGLDVVKMVEPTFSRNRFTDLCDELKHQYPGLRSLLICFENSPEYYEIETFRVKLEEAMLKADYKLRLEGLLADPENRDRYFWLTGYLNHPAELVDLLFQIGFIKLWSEKDRRYVAYYEGSFLSVDNASGIKVHDVFVAALKCHGTAPKA